MALILRNSILFLHIPKTGGSWVEQVLQEQGLVKAKISHKHATYDFVCRQPLGAQLKKMVRQAYARRFYLTHQPKIFCVVRHPMAWYESWFKYQTARNWRTWGTVGALDDWHVLSDMNINADSDFNQYMEKVNKNTPGYVSQLFSKYTANSGAIFLKTETLASDLVLFLESCELPFDRHAILRAERINESPRLDVTWDPKLREETIRNELSALKRFGYMDVETLIPNVSSESLVGGDCR